MAEGAFRAAVMRAGLEVIVESAGTASYHIGDRPDPRAIATAAANGVDISSQKGRQIGAADFSRFTHIIAMDSANLEGIKARSPRHGGAQVSLLLDWLDGYEGKAVADPYYGGDEDFAAAWALIEAATNALAQRLF